MKESTLHSLVIARTLLDRAEPLCTSEDRYLASAGLVVLQDAIEAVFYGILIELGVDESKSLERKNFDELIGELKAAGVPVHKSGTLIALNKQRVLTKHYAQVAEPITVRNYFGVARETIEVTTGKVLGRSIYHLFIADLLRNSEAKSFLKSAEIAASEKRFLDSLVEIRKAIYVEFEEDYNVFGWRDHDGKKPEGLFSALSRGGWRAPFWTRTKDWIEENVHIPTDYIQIDRNDWRLQAMELGIHTMELENLQTLTPAVFRPDRKSDWSVTYAANFPANNATEANTKYCLDRSVAIILKKQEHAGARREPAKDVSFDPPPVYIGRVMFEKPSTHSTAVHTVTEGFTYTILRIVGGFDPSQRFYEMWAESDEQSDKTLIGMSAHSYKGYLQILPETAV
jgi:hypothetical protein